MRISTWLGGWAVMLGLFAAQPAAAGWPNALPAQPLSQAPRICAPNVVALYRRCRVIDFAPLGQTADGRQWYYAYFSTHWADRHGHTDRGFPVIFFLQPPTTLRLGLWLNDEPDLAGHWALTPPTRPVLIKRPEADYLGFTLKTSQQLDDQRLFRQNKLHWKEIDILHRAAADQSRLDDATPAGCEAADDGYYDWGRFWLVQALRRVLTHAPCGFITAELAVSGKSLTVTSAAYHSPPPRPASPDLKGSTTPSGTAPPLTPALSEPTSSRR